MTKWPRRGALIERRLRWGLTWRAWVVVLLLVIGGGLLVKQYAYTFLAPVDIVPTDVMVVEGWMADAELPAVRSTYRLGHYHRVFLTGGPLLKSDPMHRYMTYPDLMMLQLIDMGFKPEEVFAVPAPLSRRDRTYASAEALRHWFDQHGGAPSALNVVTVGCHARRSRLVFELALGPQVKVGVIPVPTQDFEEQRWWASSDGFKTVMTEVFSYLYTVLIFRPMAPKPLAALTAL